MAHGMSEDQCMRQLSEITVYKNIKNFKIFKGMEVDIRKMENWICQTASLKLDIVIASVHSAMTLPEKEQTDRVICALKSVRHDPRIPGRLIGSRNSWLWIWKNYEGGRGYGVALESTPVPRLDLHDVHCHGERWEFLFHRYRCASFQPIFFYAVRIFTANRGWLKKPM